MSSTSYLTGSHLSGDPHHLDAHAQIDKILTGVTASPALDNRYLPGNRFRVDDYGADPTGVGDSTTAFTGAITAAQAALTAGTYTQTYIVMSSGKYKVTCGSVAITDERCGILGAGEYATTVNAQGSSGACFTITAPNFSTRHNGAPIRDFTIDGTATTGACYGIRYQDVGSADWQSVSVLNFAGTGAIGIFCYCIAGWMEGHRWRKVTSTGNSTQFVFDGGTSSGPPSFDYNDFDLRSTTNPGQAGIVVRGNAPMFQARLKWSFNSHVQSGAQACTAITVGTTASDTSTIDQTAVQIQGEYDGTGSVVKDVDLGAAAKIRVFGNWWFEGSYTAGTISSGFYYVSGMVNAPSLTKTLFSQAGISVKTNQFWGSSTRASGIALVDTTGSGTTVRATIYSGSGLPTSLFAQPGDIYIRNDTPGNQSQIFYVNTGAGNNNTWTALTIGAGGGGISLAGDLGNTTASPQVISTHLAAALPVAQGGTGQNSVQAALNALAAATTSGSYLRGNGTNVVMSAIQGADIPYGTTANTAAAGNDARFTTLVPTQQAGTTYTFAATDAATVVESTSGSATTFTVPPNSSVNFPVNTMLYARQYGTGQLTLAAGSGVTFDNPGVALTVRARYGTVGLHQRTLNEWVLSGDMS